MFSDTLGFSFSTLIHPSAVLSSEVEIEEGVQIMAGATIQRNVKIGISDGINVEVLEGVTRNDEIKVWNIIADETEVEEDERDQEETAEDMTD